MNMTTVLVFWLGLGVATIALAIYRKILVKSEDTNIHLTSGGASVINSQAELDGKLTTIDKWGKTLTVITFLMGLAIGAKFVYEALLAVPY